MEFRLVESYYRQEHFDFYRSYRHPFYALTFPLRCSGVSSFAEAGKVSKYLSLCYLFTRAMQPLEDFRYRLRQGRIVLYERLHLGMTVPAPGGRFRFAYHRYHPEPAEFFRRAVADGGRALKPKGDEGALLEESEHENFIYFTALPKVPFTSFTHAAGSPEEAAPRVAFGRFYEQDGELMVPVGLQVNHLFVDGAAVGELVESAQRHFDEPAG